MPQKLKVPKGWKKEGKWLVRKYKFKTFLQALGFLNIVGTIGEELMHHPDAHLENYNNLTLKITSHRQGKLTQKDFELAGRIEKILSKDNRSPV